MNCRFLLPLLILICTFTSTYGETQRPAASGAGAMSCGKWIEGREMQNEAINSMLVAWLQGFLSGMNTMRAAMTKHEMAMIPDPSTLLAYVDKACKDKPLQGVYSISIRLYGDIQKQ